ncbi:MAG: hypothetical protein K9J17_00005, partial [Flavobacteriales bacterium]|nr:hypothetical protein [Flavobacteriales bacterium]
MDRPLISSIFSLRETRRTSLCTLLVLLFLTSPLLTLGQVFVPFTTRTVPATYKIKGDFAMIGNTNLTLQNYGDNTGNQNQMIYVDIDGLDSTFNSSSATLEYSTENGAADECTNVLFAGLYWTGRTEENASSPLTFNVTNQIQTGTTPVNQNYTVNHNDDIPDTGYDLQVSRGGSSGNRYPIYTFSDGTNTYVFSFTNNTGANRVTLSVNGGTPVNVPVTYTTAGANGTATLTTPYVITIGGVDLTIISLVRDTGTNLNTTDTQNGADANVNVSGIAPVYSNYTQTVDKGEVKLKGPGATYYSTQSTTEIYFPLSSNTADSAYGMFAAYKDITTYVQTHGPGEYFVADVALKEGAIGSIGLYGGWGMVVVYENYLMTWRDITVFDGHAYVPSSTTSYQIPVTGFQTTPAGPVNLRVGVMAGEGDAPYSGDYFQIRNAANNAWVGLSHGGNTTGNFFNSSIFTGGNPRNPTILNNSGLDISAFTVPNPGNTVMANNQTSTTFRYGSTQDTYIIYNITMSSDSYVPEVEGLISVSQLNGSPVVPDPLVVGPGDLMTFNIDVRNIGNEEVLNHVITIPMPSTGTLVPGSMVGSIFFTPTPTPNNLYFDPSAGPTGSIIWDFGTLPLPADPQDLLATLSFTIQVVDNCILLNDAACASAITTTGTLTGTGSVTGVALQNSGLITGYESGGTCQGEPLTEPLTADIVVPANYVSENCTPEQLQTDFPFCYSTVSIPVDSIDEHFPAGTRYFNEFPVTVSSIEYTTSFPAVAGTTTTYYAVPSILDDACGVAITISVCEPIDAVDDLVPSIDCQNGETNVINVLTNDDLGGSAPSISDVVLTIITPDPTGYVTINADGSVDVAPNTPPATYTVTYEICEAAFPTNCDQATLTISDNTAPVAACQNITVQLDATGNITVSGLDVDNGSSDDCGIAAYTLSTSAFSCSDLGANVVTLTVEDGGGNTDNCSATITVQDVTNPTAVCQNITVQLDASGNASIVAADVDNGSNDNCSVTLSATPLSFTCANTGANTVTLTATDPSGNTDQCTATVTIEDTVDPTAICQNITVQLDASGNASIIAADVDNGSNDNCSVTLSATPLTFTCANTGANTITLTATDPSGNTDQCTATVTIEDTVDPTAICQNITVQLDASGNASIV